MKKSLLIVTLLFFVFNLFGQESKRITIQMHTIKTDLGYGIMEIDNKSERSSLLNIGYNYKITRNRNWNSYFFFQTGIEFTHQFPTMTIFPNHLSFTTIPIGFSFRKNVYRFINAKLDARLNNNFILFNNGNLNSTYFRNYNVGLGITIYDIYDIGVEHNFQNKLNYVNTNNQLKSLNYSSWNLNFLYCFYYKRHPAINNNNYF